MIFEFSFTPAKFKNKRLQSCAYLIQTEVDYCEVLISSKRTEERRSGLWWGKVYHRKRKNLAKKTPQMCKDLVWKNTRSRRVRNGCVMLHRLCATSEARLRPNRPKVVFQFTMDHLPVSLSGSSEHCWNSNLAQTMESVRSLVHKRVKDWLEKSSSVP